LDNLPAPQQTGAAPVVIYQFVIVCVLLETAGQ
jgi:hypothetical protein